MTRCLLMVCTFLVMGSSLALGQIRTPSAIFQNADNLFKQRDNNLKAVTDARNAYLQIYANARGMDLVYAVQQLGRLAQYEGMYLVPTRDRARKARIFDQCREWTDALANDETLVTYYVYWRMACSSLFMKYATLTQRLGAIGELRTRFDEVVGEDLEIRPEINVDPRYMGGGIFRVLAGIYVNTSGNMLRDTLPDEEKAFTMVSRALAAHPYPGTQLWGTDFYTNYTSKAQVLEALGQIADAELLLEEAIEEIQERIDDDDLPEGLEPETKGEQIVMRSMTRL
jgi:tetratricopeptide (TPR) repeat protein